MDTIKPQDVADLLDRWPVKSHLARIDELNIAIATAKAEIRAKIMRRKAEALVAEITATDWNDQPHFQSVDDFLNFADAFIEQSEADPAGSQKRR